MCLAALAFGMTERYPLVLAANRDEMHQRPSAAADWWQDLPGILGGRDLVAGGSWLAVDSAGRLAAVTNVRESPPGQYPRSRGHLVRDFLANGDPASDFLASLSERQDEYAPYNLLLFDQNALHYASNRAPERRLQSGVYALSNAALGARWPKVRHAEKGLSACLEADRPDRCLFELLAEPQARGGPAIGDAETSRYESAVFIRDEHYGTRCSTIVLLSREGELVLAERRFDFRGQQVGESRHRFRLQPNPQAARATIG